MFFLTLPLFLYPSYVRIHLFPTNIYFLLSVYNMDYWDTGFEKRNCGPWTATHIHGKSHQLVKSRWSQIGQNCLPSEKNRPAVCHGIGMTPIETCSWTLTLGDERCMLRGMLEDCILTPWKIDDIHLEDYSGGMLMQSKGWYTRWVVKFDNEYYHRL